MGGSNSERLGGKHLCSHLLVAVELVLKFFTGFLLGNSNQQIPTGLSDFGQYQQYRGRGIL